MSFLNRIFGNREKRESSNVEPGRSCSKCEKSVVLWNQTITDLAKIGVEVGPGRIIAERNHQFAEGLNDIYRLFKRVASDDAKVFWEIWERQAHACSKCGKIFCGECGHHLPSPDPDWVDLSAPTCHFCGGIISGPLKSWPT